MIYRQFCKIGILSYRHQNKPYMGTHVVLGTHYIIPQSDFIKFLTPGLTSMQISITSDHFENVDFLS